MDTKAVTQNGKEESGKRSMQRALGTLLRGSSGWNIAMHSSWSYSLHDRNQRFLCAPLLVLSLVLSAVSGVKTADRLLLNKIVGISDGIVW